MSRVLMKHLSLAGLCLALASSGLAQATIHQIDLPTNLLVPSRDSFPFGGPPMRYQQWFSAAEWQATAVNPIRVVGLQFKAGSPGGQPGKQVDIEVKMANTVLFRREFDDNLGVMKDQDPHFAGAVLMATATPGTFPLALTFTRDFIWDGVSGVTVEIKVFDNGNFGQSYTYDLEATFTGFGKISRAFNITGPTMSTATFFGSGQGLSMRFDFLNAISHPFATGCPGGGGIVPEASTQNGPPQAANSAWRQILTGARPDAPAFFILGQSRTLWQNITLPLDLGFIPANGCFLLVEARTVRSVMTSPGFGFGDGSVDLALPIPPDVSLRGRAFFSQWLVLDPDADNGLMAASQGLIHVVGS